MESCPIISMEMKKERAVLAKVDSSRDSVPDPKKISRDLCRIAYGSSF